MAVVALCLLSGDRPAGQAANTGAGALATVQAFVRANETGNLEEIVGTFDADATVFFPNGGALPPARVSGATQIRAAFEALFKARSGPITLTSRDVRVQSYGDIAIVTLHLGDAPALSRRTFVLRRRKTRWLIVHLHASNTQASPYK